MGKRSSSPTEGSVGTGLQKCTDPTSRVNFMNRKDRSSLSESSRMVPFPLTSIDPLISRE